MDWPAIILLIIGAGSGTILGIIANRVINMRRERATDSTAEATAIQNYQAATKAANEMIAAASEEIEKARRNGEAWYTAMVAMRAETAALIAEARAESQAEILSLRTRNEEQAAALATMASQLDQRTVDHAEVEWARMRNVEYEAMKAELIQLRADVQEVPHLRAEVARLTALLEDEQRQARANEELLRKNLNHGGPPNG